MFQKNRVSSSILLRALKILPKSDQPKIIAMFLLQVSLGFLDLLGVAAIGILGALSVTGIQSQQPGDRISGVLKFLNLYNLNFQSQVAILGLCAALILVIRTIISIIVTRRIFFFLSRRGAALSSELISRVLSQPLLEVQARSTQETLYAVTSGVSAVTLGVLATSVSLVADSSLLIIMIAALFIVDPLTACTSLLFFGTLGFILYKIMNVKAHNLGYLNSELSVESNEKLLEVLDSFRESVVRNRREYYAEEIGKIRFKLADVLAEMQLMPNVNKYVIESGMVVGAVVIAGAQFAFQDAKHAVAALSVFLAAGTRIAPAILRLQQSLVQIRIGLGSAMPTLALIEQLKNPVTNSTNKKQTDFQHLGFLGEVRISNVSFTYPNSDKKALSDLNLKVTAGSSLAIVGPSGAGKTTLVDVLLGVISPDSGDVLISGKSPSEAIREWSGAIAYVPQNVAIANASIRENVALGFPKDFAGDDRISSALAMAQLTNFVDQLPNGLNSGVGERGAKISGGQKQRLGIARALFTSPKLLVLDEATSALDGQTEAELSEAISSLAGDVTVILIAHRLSTVKSADQVVYMQNGRILAQGTFAEVRQAVPDFDKQAGLNGI
jgi:ABC-type multidrug transport system fused ATPase/permease subunit